MQKASELYDSHAILALLVLAKVDINKRKFLTIFFTPILTDTLIHVVEFEKSHYVLCYYKRLWILLSYKI